jgi:hypothetical protein
MPTLESIQTADPLRRLSVRIGPDRCRVAVVTHCLSLPTIAAGRTRRRRGTTGQTGHGVRQGTGGHGRQRLRGRLLISFRAHLICSSTETPAPWQGRHSIAVGCPALFVRSIATHVSAGLTSFACVRLLLRAGLLGHVISGDAAHIVGYASWARSPLRRQTDRSPTSAVESRSVQPRDDYHRP